MPAERGKRDGGDNNRYRRRELASRDLATALREYAPGADVVMDGLVYRSAGITLNWHVPASETEIHEIQSIKRAWRCGACGATGTTIRLIRNCDACGADLQEVEPFLEPAGFSVDFYSEPHVDITKPTYVPVQRPWISARGAWTPLPNPELGRYRLTTDGRVFHYSRGLFGTGYAVCLACGRSEPLTPEGELPEALRPGHPHKKLRSKKDDRDCPGSKNPWAIQKLLLGHELRTDVVEFQLRDTTGQPVHERETAMTIAIAMRDSLASLLGIQSTELGCDVQEKRQHDGRYHSIYIYDHAAAGYASSAERWIPQLFQSTVKLLECPRQCDSCCPHCILDFDQRFEAGSLDRHKALKVLSGIWLSRMKLPAQFCHFGEASRVETAPLSAAILREAAQQDTTLVRLFAGGDQAEWDFAASTLRDLAYKAAAKGRPVELVLPHALLQALSEEDRYSLASAAEAPDISVATVFVSPKAGFASVLAEVHRGAGLTVWASTDQTAVPAGPGWGQPNTECPLIIGNVSKSPLVGTSKIAAAKLRPVSGDVDLNIGMQINGDLKGVRDPVLDLSLSTVPTAQRTVEFGNKRDRSFLQRSLCVYASGSCTVDPNNGWRAGPRWRGSVRERDIEVAHDAGTP
jgi:DEAD/DEAH box helicase domain-containing protein